MAFVASRDLEVSGQFYGGVLGFPLVASSGFAKVYEVVGLLRAAGVQFTRYEGMNQDENGVWTVPGGARIAWFTDPDGNTLSLQQEIST